MDKCNSSVVWYLPNIIGYFRVILVVACLFLSVDYPVVLVTMLAIAGLLDVLDGYVARRFNQSSYLGSVLDYLTDRVTTVVYVKILSLLLPEFSGIIYALFMIDMASHMARLYVTMWSGEYHHKKVVSDFKLLNLYYPQKSVSIVMGICTHSYETFLITLILMQGHVFSVLGPQIFYFALIISAPGFITKNVVHVIQLAECFRFAKLKHS